MIGGQATSAPKVLLLSETLGTPSFQHPWRDYSVAILECLKDAGADVTLVVERAFGFDAGGGPGAMNEETRLTSVYGYLTTGEYNPRLFYRGSIGRPLALHVPALVRFFASWQHRRTLANERVISNRPADTTRLPERVAYLRHVDRFLFPRRFYSSANLRAVHDTGPAEIDGSGYDLVMIDGLLPIRVTGAAAGRVATLLHDLATVSAPDVRAKTRLIAGQALVCMAQHQGVAIFANDHARERFDALGAGILRKASIVLGPVVSRRVRALFEVASEPGTSAYLAGVELKGRKAAFLHAVSSTGILEQLVRSTVSGSDGQSSTAPVDSLTGPLPTVALIWPGGSAEELRPLTKLAADLAGSARIVALGAKLPEPLVPKPGLPIPKPIEIPLNLHLASDLPERDRLDLMRDATLLIYPERAGAGAKLLEAVALDAEVLCFDTPINRIMLGSARATFVPRTAGSLAPFILACLSRSEIQLPAGDRNHHGGSAPPTAGVVDVFRALLSRTANAVSAPASDSVEALSETGAS